MADALEVSDRERDSGVEEGSLLAEALSFREQDLAKQSTAQTSSPSLLEDALQNRERDLAAVEPMPSQASPSGDGTRADGQDGQTAGMGSDNRHPERLLEEALAIRQRDLAALAQDSSRNAEAPRLDRDR